MNLVVAYNACVEHRGLREETTPVISAVVDAANSGLTYRGWLYDGHVALPRFKRMPFVLLNPCPISTAHILDRRLHRRCMQRYLYKCLDLRVSCHSWGKGLCIALTHSAVPMPNTPTAKPFLLPRAAVCFIKHRKHSMQVASPISVVLAQLPNPEEHMLQVTLRPFRCTVCSIIANACSLPSGRYLLFVALQCR